MVSVYSPPDLRSRLNFLTNFILGAHIWTRGALSRLTRGARALLLVTLTPINKQP
jgi:hypothetical protein